MQLVPSTASAIARRWHLSSPGRDGLFDPAIAVPLGAAYLRELLDRYGEQLALSLAAYNAGPAAIAHWLPPGPMDADIWIENIPTTKLAAMCNTSSSILWPLPRCAVPKRRDSTSCCRGRNRPRRSCDSVCEQMGVNENMKSNLLLCAAIVAGAALADAAPTAAVADTVVVSADRMIDVLTGRVVEHPQITVTDGRIAAVGVQGSDLPAGARRVDLPGMTLVPGLIDMHTHLTSDPHFSGYRHPAVHG